VSIPNLISLARLFAVPLTVWLLLEARYASAFWVFAAAGASDALDGFIAKRFNRRSVLGSYLDPLADKALLVSVYVALGHVDAIPVWLVILVVFRDILIIGGALLLYTLKQSLRMRPLLISKLNTATQILLVVAVLLGLGYGIDDMGSVRLLVYLAALTTFASGAAYVVSWSRRVAEVEKAG
jgi:cardiolipin synthase